MAATDAAGSTQNTTSKTGSEEQQVLAELERAREFQLFMVGINIQSAETEAFTEALEDIGDRIAQ